MKNLLLPAAVLVATLVPAPGALAAAVTRTTETAPFSESGLTNDCGPAVSGTLNGAGTTTTQTVENVNAVGKGTTVFTETHEDSGNFFTADGVFRARQTFHEVEHMTVVDGVVHVDFSKGHFHVFGIC